MLDLGSTPSGQPEKARPPTLTLSLCLMLIATTLSSGRLVAKVFGYLRIGRYSNPGLQFIIVVVREPLFVQIERVYNRRTRTFADTTQTPQDEGMREGAARAESVGK